ncbi:MAG TPA: DUF3097 family protein [Acidimicrobiales bacterium]|nr:DUF3097 family protein [Acidimicrobiales bacterium]
MAARGSWDPYQGILAGPVDGPQRVRTVYPEVPAVGGLAVAHRASGVRGRVVRTEKDAVVIRTELGTERVLSMVPGAFTVDGRAVTLVRAPSGPTGPARTASGSRAAPTQRARVARASRIWVEGVHDAELVEKVWGDDLRVEGVVVERLDGIDHLQERVDDFQPGPDARLGVLVDHLVTGSKEARLAAAIDSPFVLVRGTPFVDVWQAVRPKAVGIPAWPLIPVGRPWKDGVCAALGIDDPAGMWRRLLAAVGGYSDLEPELVGAVEALIDFVTA